MVCICGNTGIYNEVMRLGYFYCRECKSEITLQEVIQPYQDDFWNSPEAHKQFEEWLDFINNRQAGEFDKVENN